MISFGGANRWGLNMGSGRGTVSRCLRRGIGYRFSKRGNHPLARGNRAIRRGIPQMCTDLGLTPDQQIQLESTISSMHRMQGAVHRQSVESVGELLQLLEKWQSASTTERCAIEDSVRELLKERVSIFEQQLQGSVKELIEFTGMLDPDQQARVLELLKRWRQ